MTLASNAVLDSRELNSRGHVDRERSVYVASAPADDHWQMSVAFLQFDSASFRGMPYFQIRQQSQSESELAREFAAWEALTDEAWADLDSAPPA
jgi:hypothetical protein